MTIDDPELVTLADGVRLNTWTRVGSRGAPAVVLLDGSHRDLDPLVDLIGDEASTYRYECDAGESPGRLPAARRSVVTWPTSRSSENTGGSSGWW